MSSDFDIPSDTYQSQPGYALIIYTINKNKNNQLVI